MLAFLIVFTPVLLLVLVVFLVFKRECMRKKLEKDYKIQARGLIVSFFHPYCNCGGGGERVLWTGIAALLQRYNNLFFFIYTNDRVCLSTPDAVFKQVNNLFSLDIKSMKGSDRISFVPLMSEPLLRPKMYPHFTLLGQFLGSVIAAFEALIRCPSDVFIDTTGFAFTMPVFSTMIGAVCGAYIHYPTISSDMANRVIEHNTVAMKLGTGYNNSETIRNSACLTKGKLIYYFLLRWMYGFAGKQHYCKHAAVNSSWTRRHISGLFGRTPFLLYPPCPVNCNVNTGLPREPWILSIGQFRPEKNHQLQMEAFNLFLESIEKAGLPVHAYRLLLVGGCRDNDDYALVQTLKELVKSYGREAQVDFKVNLPSEKLKELLTQSTINLHTMVDEHFGIGIVEGMAAEMVTVANRSGGPLTDIIGPAQAYIRKEQNQMSSITGQPPVGFLASTSAEYANTFYHIFVDMKQADRQAIGKAARKRAIEFFSEDNFSEGWLKFFAKLGF